MLSVKWGSCKTPLHCYNQNFAPDNTYYITHIYGAVQLSVSLESGFLSSKIASSS